MKNLYVLLLLCFCTAVARAQYKVGAMGNDLFQVLYTVQYQAASFDVWKPEGWQQSYVAEGRRLTTGLDEIEAKTSSGFGIGVGLSRSLSERFAVRLIPTFVLNDRILVYHYKVPAPNAAFQMDSYVHKQTVQTALAELPLSVKLSSDRRRNFGVYVTAGGKYAYNLKSGDEDRGAATEAMARVLRNQRSSLSYEAGLGLDFFFSYFKLSPEIRYSSTFGNLLKQDNHVYSSPLDRLKLRQVTFSLYIE